MLCLKVKEYSKVRLQSTFESMVLRMEMCIFLGQKTSVDIISYLCDA